MSRTLAVALPVAFWLGARGSVAADGVPWLALGTLALLAFTRPPGPMALVLAAAAGGALCGAGERRWRAATPPTPPSSPFEATVSAVTLRGPWVDVRLAPDTHPDHRAIVRLTRRPPGLAPGARVRAVARLRSLAPADEPGGWDAEARGGLERVVWRGRGAVDLRRPAEGVAEWPLRAREAARRRLAASERPYGAALLTGLLLGDRAAVPESALEALRATGTGHLLAVSGLHVGGLALVLAGLALAAARRALAAHPERWALLAAPAVLGFVALAQFPLSACRAGLMVGLYLAGRALGRRTDPVVVLGWAAVVLLARGPAAGSGAGFQLSFGAVAALLWLGAGRGPIGAVLTAVVAAAATAPIEAWHFGTVAPGAPVANLLLCPPVALVLVPLGLLGLALAPLTPLPLELAAIGAEMLAAVAETLAGHGGSLVVGRWMAPAIAIPLAALVGWRAGRPRMALAAAGVLAMLAAIGRPTASAVDFLPVGQGDAVLLRGRHGAVLVDAGPDPRGFRLVGALRRAGIRRLEAVAISHAHPDHFAGLGALLDRFEIGEIWFNGRPGGQQWRALARRVAARGMALRAPPDGLDLGGLRLTALTGGGAGLSENDASLTMRVDGSAASVLLTGDVEAAGEARLLAEALGPVSVLKSPHHGSRTSSGPALLARLCPAAVVHTVGRHNRHRLPHPAVEARYAAAGIDGYRTDRDGRVTVDLDEGRIRAHRRPARDLPPAGCGVSQRGDAR